MEGVCYKEGYYEWKEYVVKNVSMHGRSMLKRRLV